MAHPTFLLVVALAAAGADRLLEAPAAETSRARDTIGQLRDANPDAQLMLRSLQWRPRSFTVTVEQNADRALHHEAWVTFPSPKPLGDPVNDRVTLEWYPAAGDLPKAGAPALIILHILDGRMLVARSIALACAPRGIHAFVLHLPGYGARAEPGKKQDARDFLARAHQGIADARRALDAVGALQGVDKNRIGLQGTSLGGFVAATAGALDGKFDSVHLVLAGGELDRLVTEGRKDSAAVMNELRKTGLQDVEIERLLHSVDPTRIAHRLNKDRTWLFSANADQVVPRACAVALGLAAGLDEQHHIWVPGNHYTVVAFLPSVLLMMTDHVLHPSKRAGSSSSPADPDRPRDPDDEEGEGGGEEEEEEEGGEEDY